MKLQAVEWLSRRSGFLKVSAGNEATFNSYRNPQLRAAALSPAGGWQALVELRRGRRGLHGVLPQPSRDWIGPGRKSRLLRVGGRKIADTDTSTVNLQWRDLSVTP